MARTTPEQALAAAQKALDEARKRRAEIRARRRSVEVEGTEAADRIRVVLYQAGRDGREPEGIDELRQKVVALQVAHADLVQLEEGADRAVTDAGNSIAAIRFTHAPAFEEKLTVQAETIAAERAQLEQKLAMLAEQEEDVRAAWRELAAAIPGQPGDLPFDDGATIPARRPTEPHPAISNYVPTEDWPGWFYDCVRHAETLYGARQEVSA